MPRNRPVGSKILDREAAGPGEAVVDPAEAAMDPAEAVVDPAEARERKTRRVPDQVTVRAASASTLQLRLRLSQRFFGKSEPEVSESIKSLFC
jgi:hypothetical protein